VTLRFASHLGFPNPQHPLFGAAVGSVEPAGQIAFAVEHGLAGVFDPFAAMRTPTEQEWIGRLVSDSGLAIGGFLYLPFNAFAKARWGTTEPEARKTLLDDIEASIAIARRLGSRQIALISIAEESVVREAQHEAMATNLRFAGDIVSKAGMILCVEGLTPARFPMALLHGITESAEVVSRCGHPAIRLLFDTAHCHASGEDVLEMVETHWDLTEVVQLADSPGRVEIGAGEINFEGLFKFLAAREYSGLCELEHGWLKQDAAPQLGYVDELRSRYT
jgi:hydroxypyruvate isomerase